MVQQEQDGSGEWGASDTDDPSGSKAAYETDSHSCRKYSRTC